MKPIDPPLLFHIDSVRDALSLQSWLIPDEELQVRKNKKPCGKCLYDTYEPPSDLLVEGFDDLLEVDRFEASYFPEGPPLIGNAPLIDSLAEQLSGVVSVRVGFRHWNQRLVPETDWFTHPPDFRALWVTAVCSSAYAPDGSPFTHCSFCGRMQIAWHEVREAIGGCSIDLAAWPGTDLFLLEGGMHEIGVLVTGDGVRKMKAAGFCNLQLTPVSWRRTT